MLSTQARVLVGDAGGYMGGAGTIRCLVIQEVCHLISGTLVPCDHQAMGRTHDLSSQVAGRADG